MEEIELANEAGLDLLGIGVHHQEEYLSLSPTTILSAAAARTKQIKLSSAVTVLGSKDPVRAYQQFATIDQPSKDRTKIMVGQGSFIESFPLFGYDLQDYEELVEGKMDLLLKIRESEIITWSGERRADIDNRGVYQQPYQDQMSIWRAVGRAPKSAYQAGRWGYQSPKLSINSHGFIVDYSKEAADIAFPVFKVTMDKTGKERGWTPMTCDQCEASRTLRGANAV